MKKLKVNILRGKENIGENLIEVSDKKTKIYYLKNTLKTIDIFIIV